MKINKKNEYMKPAKSDFNLLHSKIDEFPEISKIKKKQDDATHNVMNYLEKAKKETIKVSATLPASPKETEIKVDNFNYLEVNFQMSKMISRWDDYTNTYKKLYGDEIYDKMYLFPNYNYEYFDMLDSKYEYEQEEMEISEKNESYDDLSDYYIFDKYDL